MIQSWLCHYTNPREKGCHLVNNMCRTTSWLEPPKACSTTARRGEGVQGEHQNLASHRADQQLLKTTEENESPLPLQTEDQKSPSSAGIGKHMKLKALFKYKEEVVHFKIYTVRQCRR